MLGTGSATEPHAMRLHARGAKSPANEMLSMNYNGTGEIRTYNNMLQVTGVVGNGIGMTYVYPGPGANNGKACLAIDFAAGEQVAYSYDSLNRLSTANAYTNGGASGCTPSGSQTWGQSYTYDVYGNLTDKNVTAGSAPSLHVIADAATNRVSGFGYDANGNATAKSDGTMGYDAENRMMSFVGSGGSPQMYYGYDARNKRLWSSDGSTDANANRTPYNLYFYGIDGHRLGTYRVSVMGNSTPFLSAYVVASDTYFGSRRLAPMDRLGSTNGKFYPYGEDKAGNPGNDTWKFATYFRDSVTGLDYADQRYYSNSLGRFTRPDPAIASASPGNPQSWNRYSYVNSDPVNSADPQGLCSVVIGGITQTPYSGGDDDIQQEFANEVGAISAYPYAGGNPTADLGRILVQGAGIPIGATLNAVYAISLAAQNPGPISIIAFSGGAAAFSSAWPYLRPEVQNRITSITYIDPGALASIQGGNGATVTVFDDAKGLNMLVQLFGGAIPFRPTFVDTGDCGHSFACVINRYTEVLSRSATNCPLGAGGVFGASSSFYRFGVSFSTAFSYLSGISGVSPGFWYEIPPTPWVTSKISYGLP